MCHKIFCCHDPMHMHGIDGMAMHSMCWKLCSLPDIFRLPRSQYPAFCNGCVHGSSTFSSNWIVVHQWFSRTFSDGMCSFH